MVGGRSQADQHIGVYNCNCRDNDDDHEVLVIVTGHRGGVRVGIGRGGGHGWCGDHHR